MMTESAPSVHASVLMPPPPPMPLRFPVYSIPASGGVPSAAATVHSSSSVSNSGGGPSDRTPNQPHWMSNQHQQQQQQQQHHSESNGARYEPPQANGNHVPFQHQNQQQESMEAPPKTALRSLELEWYIDPMPKNWQCVRPNDQEAVFSVFKSLAGVHNATNDPCTEQRVISVECPSQRRVLYYLCESYGNTKPITYEEMGSFWAASSRVRSVAYHPVLQGTRAEKIGAIVVGVNSSEHELQRSIGEEQHRNTPLDSIGIESMSASASSSAASSQHDDSATSSSSTKKRKRFFGLFG